MRWLSFLENDTVDRTSRETRCHSVQVEPFNVIGHVAQRGDRTVLGSRRSDLV
jgi:hypothetical protein